MVKINRNALSGSEALRHMNWLRRYIFPSGEVFHDNIRFQHVYYLGNSPNSVRCGNSSISMGHIHIS